MHLSPPPQVARLLFSGSVIVHSLLISAPIVCVSSMFGPYFVMLYSVSFLVLQREIFLLYFNCFSVVL